MLSFEGSDVQGSTAILGKLTALPFQRSQHRISTIDAQPSLAPGSLLVFVTGEILIDEETNPQRFSQTFQLVQSGDSFWVYNDIFRLNYS